MKRIILGLVLLFNYTFAATWVLPTRLDLNIMEPRHSLPFSAYTNASNWYAEKLYSTTNVVGFDVSHTDADMVDSNCVLTDGIGDKLVSTSFTGQTITSFVGTAVPTVGVGEITFTAGTVIEMILSNGSRYTFAGGLGMGADEPDVSGNGNHGTWSTGAGGTTTLRSGKQDVVHSNQDFGHSKQLYFNGVNAYAHESEIIAESLDSLSFTSYFDTEITATSPLDIRLTLDSSITTIISFGTGFGTTSDETITFGSGDRISYSKDTIPIGWHTVNFVWDTDRYEISMDGTPLTTYRYGTPTQYSSRQIHVGRRGATGSFSEFVWQGIVINGVSYETENAYDNGTNIIIPDSIGTNNVIGYNTAEKYTPADRSNPGYDTDGNELTNPSCVTGRIIHNNSETSFVFNSTTNSYADLITHTNFVDDMVVFSDTNSFITEIIVNDTWFTNDYEAFLPRMTNTSQNAAQEPLKDVGDDYILDVNDGIIFVHP